VLTLAFALAAVTAAAGDADSLRAAIDARIGQNPEAVIAVSFLDLETGDSISINRDSVFHAASTMKVPVMMEVLRRSQLGGFSLDQGLLLVNQFASIVDGSPYSLDASEDGDTAVYARIGERVTVRDLMTRMITRSSNLATNQLIELVGAKAVTATARQLGAARIQVLRGVEDQKAFDKGMINTTTSSDLAVLLASERFRFTTGDILTIDGGLPEAFPR